MHESLRQQFERLAMRRDELEANLADPAVSANVKRYRELSREHAEVSARVDEFRAYESRERDLADASAMLSDAQLAEFAQEEITAAKSDLDRMLRGLQAALLPRDPDDARNAFVTEGRKARNVGASSINWCQDKFEVARVNNYSNFCVQAFESRY